MYPKRELTRLAHRKVALQRAIALRRIQCAGAAARVAEPFLLIDRLRLAWHWVGPLGRAAAVAFGLLNRPAAQRRGVWLRRLLRWGPVAITVVRSLRFAFGARGER